MLGTLANHLWQSTAFAAAAGLFTVAFRKNRAHVRFELWLCASFKFLVPFSLLMSLGSRWDLSPAAKRAAPPAVSAAMLQISQPFGELRLEPGAPSAARTRDWLPIAILGGWACGFAILAAIRLRDWRRIQAALRASTPVNLHAGVEVHLAPAQLKAVLAHELCHIRRRDNLTSAIHMFVEAVFWFHPLVWWIGARLMEERERACDEAVLSLGSEPLDYAEGILTVCKSYVESPLSLVSGVTGANLKKRIHAILTGRIAADLNFAKKLALAAAAIATVASPIAVGIMSSPGISAQARPAAPRFETASIKSCDFFRRPNPELQI